MNKYIFNYYKGKEKIDKIFYSLPYNIIITCLVLSGFYWQLYGYKNMSNSIDELKYILILDKNAKLTEMECRNSAKYSFKIKTKPINQKKWWTFLKVKIGFRKINIHF